MHDNNTRAKKRKLSCWKSLKLKVGMVCKIITVIYAAVYFQTPFHSFRSYDHFVMIYCLHHHTQHNLFEMLRDILLAQSF